MLAFVTETRTDAIGRCNEALWAEFQRQGGQNVQRWHCTISRESGRVSRAARRILDLVLITWRRSSRATVLISDPYSLQALTAFIPRGDRLLLLFAHFEYTGLFRFLPRILLPILLRRFDLIFSMSEFSKRQLVELAGVPARRTTLTRMGIDHGSFRPLPNSASPVQGDYLIYVGTETKRKNIKRMLEAIALVMEQKADLILVKVGGPGADPSDREQTWALAEKLGIQKRIHFTGQITDDTLAHFYTHARALVFVTLMEGFGFPVAEAMSCGCPVIASAIPTLMELTQGSQLHVDPHNPDEIAGAVLRLLGDPSLEAQLKADGPRIAASLNWEDTARRFIEGIPG
ncbi:MAG: glycosyltransferase family 4 protein [Spirochaetales bacterium]|nr:glycosyltransferase family 4 protein [Spirochaetales bacterium]